MCSVTFEKMLLRIKYSNYTENIEADFLKNIKISSLGEKVAIPIKRV